MHVDMHMDIEVAMEMDMDMEMDMGMHVYIGGDVCEMQGGVREIVRDDA